MWVIAFLTICAEQQVCAELTVNELYHSQDQCFEAIREKSDVFTQSVANFTQRETHFTVMARCEYVEAIS